MTEEHDIKWAARQMAEGKRVRRQIWEPDSWIFAEVSGDIFAHPEGLVYALDRRDLLATDWEIAP